MTNRKRKRVHKRKRKQPQQEQPRTLYFSYGSNMDHSQMADRCPRARFVQRNALPDTKLVFRGGLADIDAAEGEYAYGAIWSITPECERILDIYEGAPRLYVKEWLRVRQEGTIKRMLVYVMRNKKIALRPPPSSYLAGIARGYAESGWGELIDTVLDRAVANAHKVWDMTDRVGQLVGRAARQKKESKS